MSKSYIIAELGINHGGSYSEAVSMIDEAKKCSCDAVKIQMYDVAEFVNQPVDYKQLELHAKLETCMLRDEEIMDLQKMAEALGLDFFASVFSKNQLERAEAIGIKRYKTAAPDLTKGYNWRNISMAWWGSYDWRFEPIVEGYTIEKVREAEVAFHCVSDYPALTDEYMRWPYRTWKPEGVSDHTAGLELATQSGAEYTYWEKHFTVTPECPDKAVSLMPEDMRRYVEIIRTRHCDNRMRNERLIKYVGRFN